MGLEDAEGGLDFEISGHPDHQQIQAKVGGVVIIAAAIDAKLGGEEGASESDAAVEVGSGSSGVHQGLGVQACPSGTKGQVDLGGAAAGAVVGVIGLVARLIVVMVVVNFGSGLRIGARGVGGVAPPGLLIGAAVGGAPILGAAVSGGRCRMGLSPCAPGGPGLADGPGLVG